MATEWKDADRETQHWGIQLAVIAAATVQGFLSTGSLYASTLLLPVWLDEFQAGLPATSACWAIMAGMSFLPCFSVGWGVKRWGPATTSFVMGTLFCLGWVIVAGSMAVWHLWVGSALIGAGCSGLFGPPPMAAVGGLGSRWGTVFLGVVNAGGSLGVSTLSLGIGSVAGQWRVAVLAFAATSLVLLTQAALLLSLSPTQADEEWPRALPRLRKVVSLRLSPRAATATTATAAGRFPVAGTVVVQGQGQQATISPVTPALMEPQTIIVQPAPTNPLQAASPTPLGDGPPRNPLAPLRDDGSRRSTPVAQRREGRRYLAYLNTMLMLPSFVSFMSNLSAYVTDSRGLGLSPQQASLLLTVQGIANLVGRLGSTAAADLVGVKVVYVVCGLGLAGGSIALVFTQNLLQALIVAAVTGVLCSGTPPNQARVVQTRFPEEDFPVVFGNGYTLAAPVMIASGPLLSILADSTGSFLPSALITAGGSLLATLLVPFI